MSEAMRRKIEARKQQAEDAELAPQMSKQQTAEHERTIADILRPRESVLQALKRLRGPTLPRTANRKRSKPNPDQVHHLCCVVDPPTCHENGPSACEKRARLREHMHWKSGVGQCLASIHALNTKVKLGSAAAAVFAEPWVSDLRPGCCTGLCNLRWMHHKETAIDQSSLIDHQV